MENLVKFDSPRVYCEWSPNEKVAMEAAVGASLGGSRTLVTMKCVGLNVAADPLMTLAYIGVEAGLVVIVADDPGMHSSQTEQDTKLYAKLARIPVLEPSDSQEAKDFVIQALELSEKFRLPVLIRTTSRVSHSRSQVETLPRKESTRPKEFIQDPKRHCPLPIWGRQMRRDLQEKTRALSKEASESTLNRIEEGDDSLGIICGSIPYQYVKEVFGEEASVLKLGMVHPMPEGLIRDFAAKVDRLVVVEELDPIIENHCRALGLEVSGKDVRNTTGELNTSLELQQVEQGLEFVVNDGKTVPCSARIDLDKSDYSRLYLYNETTGKWQYLNSYKDGVITLDTAGRYLLTNENLRFANINWSFFIAGGAVLVVIAVAYIAFKKRYWFW